MMQEADGIAQDVLRYATEFKQRFDEGGKDFDDKVSHQWEGTWWCHDSDYMMTNAVLNLFS